MDTSPSRGRLVILLCYSLIRILRGVSVDLRFHHRRNYVPRIRERRLTISTVVHTCLELGAAEAELPSLCAGETSIAPASGLGSNATVAAGERKVPIAVFFGGGFSDSEYDKITAAVKAKAPGTHFVKVQKLDVIAAGSFGPNPDTIAKIYRKKLAALA